MIPSIPLYFLPTFFNCLFLTTTATRALLTNKHPQPTVTDLPLISLHSLTVLNTADELTAYHTHTALIHALHAQYSQYTPKRLITELNSLSLSWRKILGNLSYPTSSFACPETRHSKETLNGLAFPLDAQSFAVTPCTIARSRCLTPQRYFDIF